MSAGVAHAPALGSASFRVLLSPLKRARRARRNEVRPERKSLEQLLATERWTPTRRTNPELAKVLGFVHAELGEARRLLAKRRTGQAHRTGAGERELRALLLEHAPIRSVDRAWEFVGALKRLNLRLGDQGYVAGLLEYESAHAHDAARWHTWDEHFPMTELRRLLGVYRAGRATPSQLALAVDRLTLLYLKRAEAGRNRRAVADLKRLYLSRLALALLALLVALGASADFTSRDDLWRSFTLAACAGALGSTLSGVLKLRDHLVRLDELRGFWPAMRVQPLVGASAGALVFMVLSTNAVSIGSLSADAWSSPGLLGFVAGFSEPFFLGLVDRVAVIPDRRPEETTTRQAEPQDRLPGVQARRHRARS